MEEDQKIYYYELHPGFLLNKWIAPRAFKTPSVLYNSFLGNNTGKFILHPKEVDALLKRRDI